MLENVAMETDPVAVDGKDSMVDGSRRQALKETFRKDNRENIFCSVLEFKTQVELNTLELAGRGPLVLKLVDFGFNPFPWYQSP